LTLCGYWLKAFSPPPPVTALSKHPHIDPKALERFRALCAVHEHYVGAEEELAFSGHHYHHHGGQSDGGEPAVALTESDTATEYNGDCQNGLAMDPMDPTWKAMQPSPRQLPRQIRHRRHSETPTTISQQHKDQMDKIHHDHEQPTTNLIKLPCVTQTSNSPSLSPTPPPLTSFHNNNNNHSPSQPPQLQPASLPEALELIQTLQTQVTTLEHQLQIAHLKESTFSDALSLLAHSASESIQRERNIHHQILSVLPVGVFCGENLNDDEEEDQVYVNRTFCELVGRSEKDVRNGGWIDAVHSEDRGNVEMLLRSDVRSLGNGPVKLEYRIRKRKDRTPKSVEQSKSTPSKSNSTATTNNSSTTATIEDDDVDGDFQIVGIASETLKCSIQGRSVFIHVIVDTTQLKKLSVERTLIETREAYQIQRASDADKRRLLLDEFIDSLCHEVLYGRARLFKLFPF
jgi:PAS domain-containing protein